MRTLTFSKKSIFIFIFLFAFAGYPAHAQWVDSLLFMTPYGGANGFGAIATTDLEGNGYNIKANFTGTDGKNPQATLLPASDGYFYGTARFGGNANKGTIFKFDTATNTITKVHEFNGTTHGEQPMCTLLEVSENKLYGTTWDGGAYGEGTIFELDISGTSAVFTKKIDFDGDNGRGCTNSLFKASNGKIYGMTAVGGTVESGYGTIFEYDPGTNALTVHHEFNHYDGRNPYSSFLEASNGLLYGMTAVGGTNSAGDLIDAGTIFTFDPSDNSSTSFHTFENPNDGNTPWGDLIEHSNGNIYGLTRQGGTGGDGVIFELDPETNTVTKIYSFAFGGVKHPRGTLFETTDGKLLGQTEQGGTNSAGTIFLYELGGSPAFTKKLDFNWTNGGFPQFNGFIRAEVGDDDGGGGCEDDTTNIAATTCDPELVGVSQQLFTNVLGCDSLVITTTTLLPGDTTNVAATKCDPAQVGITHQLFTNIFGCDSLVIITTTLLPSDTTNVAATTCDPAQVGVTQQLFTNIFGCDSLVITTSTLLPGDTTNIAATTCDPAQVGVTHQLFTNIYGCDSLVITTTTLLPGDTTNIAATTCDPSQAGITQQLFTNMFGCDSLVIITTTLLPSDTTYLSDTTCYPSEVGVTQQIFTNMFGCDSVVITTTSIETTPPEIVVISTPITLWPPNHKYASFDIDDFVISVTDNCPFGDVYISHATSDEPETGGGSGNTTDDIVISDDCQSIDLRKERAGNGNGRVYTIHFAVEDEGGNVGTASAQVHIPKNNGGTATDDGPVYVVDGDCSDKSSLLAIINSADDTELINAPNPFTNETNISFSTVADGHYLVKIFNLQGVEVATLLDENLKGESEQKLNFDAQQLREGIYLAVLIKDGRIVTTKKMIRMK